MIHPAPTSAIDPSTARGVLESITPGQAGSITISFPNTSYQMHLVPTSPITSEIGKRITGVIRAKARRVDIVDTGGRYVEPVYGRPRRVQGRVISADEFNRTIVVDAAIPIHCTLTDARQQPADFPLGALVSFDALDGATFTPST